MKTALKLALAALAVAVIAVAGFVTDANLQIVEQETLPPDSGAPGRFISTDGHKLHVLTIGDVTADASGAPLLLLHGFGVEGHAAWLPWASKLAATRSLILPDLLGFGHSDRIGVPGPYYSLRGQAAEIAATLDALDVRQVDIIGNALGGAVAAQFALDYPSRVRRIVFMDAAIYTTPHHIQSGILFIDRAIAWHYRAGGPRGRIARSCDGHSNCRWLRMAHIEGTTSALLAMDKTPQSSNLADRITNIGAPSLVIWGGHDAAAPVADGDKLARTLNTTIAIISDGDDMPYIAQPDRLAQRIQEFLHTPETK